MIGKPDFFILRYCPSSAGVLRSQSLWKAKAGSLPHKGQIVQHSRREIETMDRRIRLASFISRSLCVPLVAFGPTLADKGGLT